MPQLVEMDRHVSLFEQMEEQVGSVILINTFTVEPEEADQLREAWASDAAFMKQQPGFISTQLHRGIGVVRCSSTTPCGSRSSTSSGPSATPSSRRRCRTTRQAQRLRPTS
jgi:hypothetical protein